MVAERAYVSRQAAPQVERKKYVVNKKNNVQASDESKKAVFTIAAIMSFIGLLIIALSAFAATIAYGNNTISAQNKELRDEVQRLSVEIQSISSRSQIESDALTQLGMIYPTSAQCVQLKSETVPANFAEKLKTEAFK